MLELSLLRVVNVALSATDVGEVQRCLHLWDVEEIPFHLIENAHFTAVLEVNLLIFSELESFWRAVGYRRWCNIRRTFVQSAMWCNLFLLSLSFVWGSWGQGRGYALPLSM